MIAEHATRVIIKELADAGWSRKRDAKGSHSLWQCCDGRHTITVPDGHRTIRPGVVRVIRKAIMSCDCQGGA
ncbi:type II toxin-antitoxin system HicA family toxin [Nocardia sp. NPDC004604]|uniref:type II toxin-antitoxin system HicA family toxin n=1 Tax=Nocardia sp. NPDC004604 TaxID=3157013 RepID=UPI0033A1CBCA